jgi:hypothetical protein
MENEKEGTCNTQSREDARFILEIPRVKTKWEV